MEGRLPKVTNRSFVGEVIRLPAYCLQLVLFLRRLIMMFCHFATAATHPSLTCRGSGKMQWLNSAHF
jgi:hypothetical protein